MQHYGGGLVGEQGRGQQTMPKADIFDLWRYLLSVVVTIYVLLYTARTLWSYLLWFNSSKRYKVMGRYAVSLLLRARIRQFSDELIRIAGLLVTLAALVGLHWALVK
jgi:hypothetical protein